MAIVWQKQTADQLYEVRTAGNSVRLYTSGVFHSQWNPSRPLAGHIWDLLFLPAMFYVSPQQLDNAIVLGVGGGTVINLLNYFIAPKKIQGVDLDATHLSIAKRFFLDDSKNVTLHKANACSYFTKIDNQSVDFIVEDLFCGAQNDPSEAIRAVPMDEQWLSALAQSLTSAGILVVNFEDAKQLRQAFSKKTIVASGFESVYRLTTPQYENAIGVCLKKHCDKKVFNQNLERFILSRPKTKRSDLKFALTRVV